MIDKDKLMKASNSGNGKLIIEHLKQSAEKLDLNKKATQDIEKYSKHELKAMALAREILNSEIRLLTGNMKEEDSILNYLS